MRLILCWLAFSLAATAGVIQGVVLEHTSGLPLARAKVRLQPVPKPGGGEVRPLQTRAERSGHFVFSSVPDGLYIVIAERDYYFPAAYGQRRPTGQGTPVEVTANSDLFAELHMRRKGAITGRVLDENGVGMPKIPVIAYRARLPLRFAGRAESDDRGVYRIHSLEAGKYWVRSATSTLDDGTGLLPTFGPESREARPARIHPVTVDADTTDADVRPEQGPLFHLGGTVTCSAALLTPVTVTLTSETMKRTTQALCGESYAFHGLSPAVYEVFGVLQNETEAGFIELFVDHDSEAGALKIGPVPQVSFDIRRPGSSGGFRDPITVVGRREDLSEIASEKEISTTRATMFPGHWEMNAHVSPGQFIESITGFSGDPYRVRRVEQPQEWFSVFVGNGTFTRIRIVVSDHAGQITGRVLSEEKPVPGAPVFLWPLAVQARRSIGTKQILSDTQGGFRFDGLPPGDYRMLATFDVSEMDEETLEEARAVVVHAEQSQSPTVDLKLWIAP